MSIRKSFTRRLALAFLWGKDRFARLFGRTKSYDVVRLDLHGALPEESGFSLANLWHRASLDFFSATSLLRWSREDQQVKAVVVTVADLDVGWARLQSLRRSLLALRRAGKRVWVYVAEGGMREYYLASAADKILVAPAGHLAITGIAAEMMFFKGALDKLGVTAQVHRAGQYKSAAEPFTRESMSPANREMLDSLLDDLYGQIVDDIAEARHKSKAEVRTLIDHGLFLAQEALTAGLIDHVAYEDEIESLLEAQLGAVEIIEVADYQRQYGRTLRRRMLREDHGKIAVVTVDGPIKRGESVDGGEGTHAVGSTSFTTDVKEAREDESIAAIVVRITSPGGSGLASDLMWRELVKTGEEKPVVISMGDVAASGGYYLALAGGKVFAEAGTITGSIGVIAGKAVLRDLYMRVGVSKDIITRGKKAALFSDYHEFSPAEQERLDFEIQAFYQDFLTKVASCRSLSLEAVEPNAQGRVWSGRQAWSRGLVDEIGGLEEALREAKQRAGFAVDQPVMVERFPKPSSLWQLPKLLRRLPRTQLSLPVWWMKERVLAIMPFSLRFL
jgi:protease-4